MVSPSVRRRLRAGALVLGASASLGLVACGGGDDDPGKGSAAGYEKALNGFCGGLAESRTTLEKELREATADASTNPEKATGALASVFRKYSETLKSELNTLADAEAPREYAMFSRDLDSGVERTSTILEDIADKVEDVDLSGARSGDTAGVQRAITELQAAVSGAKEAEEALSGIRNPPAALARAAPACEQFGTPSADDAEG